VGDKGPAPLTTLGLIGFLPLWMCGDLGQQIQYLRLQRASARHNLGHSLSYALGVRQPRQPQVALTEWEVDGRWAGKPSPSDLEFLLSFGFRVGINRPGVYAPHTRLHFALGATKVAAI
jgi:hypothetical protein